MPSQSHKVRLTVDGEARLGALKNDVQSTFNRLDSAALKLTATLGGLAGAGGIGLLMDRQIDAAREAVAWADAIDVSVESLTAMQAATRRVGIDGEKLADILKDTSEKIGDAFRNNGGEAVEVLQSLGLNIAEINDLSPDRQLLAIADALGQVQTQGEKVQIMEALASDASRLLPLLDDNAARLREMMREADESGKTLTRLEADSLVAAGNALDDMRDAADGLAQVLASNLAPHLTRILNFATELASSFGEAESAVQDFFDELFGAGADEAFSSVSAAHERLLELEARYQAIEDRGVRGGERSRENKERTLEALQREIDVQRERLALAERQQQIMQDFRDGKPIVIDVSPGGVDDGDGVGQAERDRLASSVEAFRRSVMDKRELLIEQHFDELELLDEAEAKKIETLASYDQLRLEAAARLNAQLTELDRKGAQDREKAEADVQNRIASMRQSVAGLAVSLFRTLGQDHKEWAYASILIEKGLNIAMAIQNTAVAVTKAMAVDPTGVLAARAQSIGSFQVGLIAATGIAEAAGVGGGGGLGGGAPAPVQPVEPGGATPLLPAADQRQGATINVYIDGPALGDDRVREVVIEAVETGLANDEFNIF